MFDGQCVVHLDSHVSNMFDAGMHTTLAQRLVSIVVFDQKCFNRLTTHFSISMFGHQTLRVCPGPYTEHVRYTYLDTSLLSLVFVSLPPGCNGVFSRGFFNRCCNGDMYG